jgi:hypothetical protein
MIETRGGTNKSSQHTWKCSKKSGEEKHEKPTNHLHAATKTTTNAELPGKATKKQKYNNKLLRPTGNKQNIFTNLEYKNK